MTAQVSLLICVHCARSAIIWKSDGWVFKFAQFAYVEGKV